MGWLTDMIASVAPRVAVQRQRARLAYETGKRAYDGASRGRRMKHWNPKGTSANGENIAAAPTLRARARDAVRNDGFARRAANIMTESAIGNGIVPTADTGKDALDRAINDAFLQHVEECDASGDGDYYSQQDLACQTIIESGDVLVRRRRRREADGLAIPVQMQLLEPDHLDLARLSNGTNDVVSGIELDKLNRRLAYWLYSQHPGETGVHRPMSFTSTRIPADQIAHAFVKRRPGQLSGVPWLATALVDMRDLSELENAKLVQQKVEACFAAFVTSNDPSDPPLLGEESTDDDGRLETLEPGMIEYLETGEDIKFASPTPTSGHPEYVRSRLHRIATACDMPYMLLTGDVSQANWSSYKAGIVPFKGTIRRIQKRTLIPQYCRPSWRWFIDAAFLAGRIGELDYSVTWTLPGFEPIDRLKEAAADQMEARIGKTSMQDIIRASGGNPDRVIADFTKWAAIVDEKELVFDSDPRKVSNAGLAQNIVTGTDSNAG
tara:strand:- start:93 stop:1577 length:1485 start_codon:yes stop_codon:yes gene_type:complete